MSVYTTEIRHLIFAGYTIFDFDYPIFNEDYRAILERKIIDRYYFREIGFETAERFKHFLKEKLNVIMPYYNQLYETVGLVTKDNYNKNLATIQEHNRNATNKSSSKGNSDSNTESIFSETPQAKLQGLDYATTLNQDNQNSTGESTGEAETTESFVTKISGSGGMRYNADILKEWRTTFLNIDQMILDELNVLFLNIY